MSHIWEEARLMVDARTELARPWHYRWKGLRLYCGPLGGSLGTQGIPGFFVRDLGLVMTPRLRTAILNHIYPYTPDISNFGKMTTLDDFTVLPDFFVQFAQHGSNLSLLFHKALKVLALLGEYFDEPLQALCERTVPLLSPKMSGTQDLARGHLISDIDSSLTGEIVIERQLKRLFRFTLNLAIPLGSPAFAFERQRFPFKYFDKIKVGDPLCDDTYYFTKCDDEQLLKSMIGLFQIFAIHGLELSVKSENRTLTITCKNLHLYALGPLFMCASEMWRTLCLQARGLSHQVVAPPPFASLNYQMPKS